MDTVSYQIDGDDAIAAVSDSWADFAAANGAASLASNVVGHSLWEFVSDETTRQVYRELLVRVRSGSTVTFSFRCDSPALRRYMRMTMTARARHSVGFDSLTLKTEPREPAFVARSGSRSERLVRVCGWCKRVAVEDEWVEIEDAIERLGLFARGLPPAITHGMCPSCYTDMTALAAAA